MRKVVHFVWSRMWYVVVAGVIAAAVLISVIRLLLPLVTEYRSDVEAILSDLLNQPVKIESIDAHWRGLGPVLSLRNVQLLDNDRKQLLLRFDEAQVGIDVVDSLTSGELTPSSLRIVGAALSIVRHKDGRITVEGFQIPDIDVAEAGDERLAQWLLSQSELSFEKGDIYWHDLKAGARRLHFKQIGLHLENQGNHHILIGEAELPKTLGRHFKFQVEFDGRLSEPDGWVGQLTAEGGNISLDKWLGGGELLGTVVKKGNADFKFSSDWTKGHLNHAKGEVQFANLEILDADKKPLKYDLISGQFAWQRHEKWRNLEVTNLIVTRNKRSWPQSQFTIALSPDNQEYRVRGNFIRLQDLNDLVLSSQVVPDELRQALATLKPHGDLENVNAHYMGEKTPRERLTIEAGFRDLSLDAWKDVPKITGLDGTLSSKGPEGKLALNSTGILLDVGLMFRNPLTITSLAGNVEWNHDGKAWHLKSDTLKIQNPDLKGELTMAIDVPDDGSSPYVDMMARYQDGVGSETSKYLPVNIMPENAVKWLDRAIVSGKVTWGSMELRGSMDKFPFHDGGGKFETRFNVTDAILDYKEGWPRIEEIDAEVVFSGRSMDITAETGKILDSDVSKVEVAIENLEADIPLLTVKGKAFGTLSDGLLFIAQSPLDEEFGNYLLDLDVEGNHRLDLDLKIPLGEKDNTINGTVEFVDGRIGMKGWNLDVTKVNGKLNFTDSSLKAKDIQAELFNKQVSIDVYPKKIKSDGKSRKSENAYAIGTRLNMSVDELAKTHPNEIWSYLNGKTDLDIELIIPHVDWREEVSADLHVKSNLKGIDIGLPAPLGKVAEQERKFYLKTHLIKDPAGLKTYPRRLVETTYGKNINAAFIVEERPSGVVIERGEIGFNNTLGTLPDPGIFISGKIDDLNLDQWGRVLFPVEPEEKESKPDEVTRLVNKISLNVGNMIFLEQKFSGLSIEMSRYEDDWTALLVSEQLTGAVNWKTDTSNNPVKVELDKLVIPKFEEPNVSPKAEVLETIDPRKLPAFQMQSKQLIYDGNEVGSLVLETAPHPDGLIINKIRLDFEEGSIAGAGDWRVVDRKHNTSMNVKFESTKLDETLRRFGFTDTVEKGEGKAQITARWPASPKNFSLAHLDGHVDIDLKKGRIVDLDPGAGKILGLLSLQALPRRLTLDFSDIFKKGFSFDKISGQFEIENGDAYTNNLEMDGPSATVNLYGRTGLAARDYDQVVSVTPKLTASLPIAGALVGGPVVGAAVLAIERILRPGVEKASRHEYTVKGSWENPVVEKIKDKETEEAGDRAKEPDTPETSEVATEPE